MYIDFLEHPENMSDEELENEFKALNSPQFDEVINDDRIRFEVRSDLLEHKHEVIQEKNRRESGEWAIPLYQFGLFDF